MARTAQQIFMLHCSNNTGPRSFIDIATHFRDEILPKPNRHFDVIVGNGHITQLMSLLLSVSCSSKSRFILPFWYQLTRAHTHICFMGLWTLSGITWVSRYQDQSGFYWSKRQWVAVSSVAPVHPGSPKQNPKYQKQHCERSACRTWKELFGESNHLHESQSYHSGFCVVTVLHAVCETSAQCYHVLYTLTTIIQQLQTTTTAKWNKIK